MSDNPTVRDIRSQFENLPMRSPSDDPDQPRFAPTGVDLFRSFWKLNVDDISDTQKKKDREQMEHERTLFYQELEEKRLREKTDDEKKLKEYEEQLKRDEEARRAEEEAKMQQQALLEQHRIEAEVKAKCEEEVRRMEEEQRRLDSLNAAQNDFRHQEAHRQQMEQYYQQIYEYEYYKRIEEHRQRYEREYYARAQAEFDRQQQMAEQYRLMLEESWRQRRYEEEYTRMRWEEEQRRRWQMEEQAKHEEQSKHEEELRRHQEEQIRLKHEEEQRQWAAQMFQEWSSHVETPGEKDMVNAYGVASYLLYKKLLEENVMLIQFIKSVTEKNILVVDGCHDHIHLVLDSCKLPHYRVSTSEFNDCDLSDVWLLFLNCDGNFHMDLDENKLEMFVSNGGAVVSSDWAISAIHRAFPGTITPNGKTTKDEIIIINNVDTSDYVVCALLDDKQDNTTSWWLEDASYPIKIKNKELVSILAYSNELASKYEDGAVIVKFNWGEGVVYHMISHFYLQRTNPSAVKEAIDFALEQNSDMEFVQLLSNQETQLDYTMVQTAFTSIEVVTRILLNTIFTRGGYV
eukprot:TRINITY_DN9232_c0_g1_i1.p1 TRINITY_DN9232_c0_g1~~TRINITY_DN9232_c0_g1_i1.p1  ORF type:complete len:583 (-),score=158.22 TRINITY_DN9232_c0_g1_i1:31-1749(-)